REEVRAGPRPDDEARTAATDDRAARYRCAVALPQLTDARSGEHALPFVARAAKNGSRSQPGIPGARLAQDLGGDRQGAEVAGATERSRGAALLPARVAEVAGKSATHRTR